MQKFAREVESVAISNSRREVAITRGGFGSKPRVWLSLGVFRLNANLLKGDGWRL
jgi:hypothetical protein